MVPVPHAQGRRRERASLIGDILRALDHETGPGDREGRLTHVTMEANVPYDRLQSYLTLLADSGAVTRARVPRLTEKGRRLLQYYLQWRQTLGELGLLAAAERAGVPLPPDPPDETPEDPDPEPPLRLPAFPVPTIRAR